MNSKKEQNIKQKYEIDPTPDIKIMKKAYWEQKNLSVCKNIILLYL